MLDPSAEVEKINLLLRVLDGKTYDIQTEQGLKRFNAALDWVKGFHILQKAGVPETYRGKLESAICKSFKVTPVHLLRHLNEGIQLGHLETYQDNDAILEAILPKGGWFTDYAEYTRYNESPLAYHIFSSLTVLGAALGRKVYKSMGNFNIYPNYCVILIGPTGNKKTSASDYAKTFVDECCLCPVMSDSLTPEILTSTLCVNGGHQYIYAPEMSVLLGKQRYNEGFTQRILRLLDCPDQFVVETQVRGKEIITDVALTILGATTLSLLAKSSAEEVSSSGFLNRFLLVIEEPSQRSYPEPRKGNNYETLKQDVYRMKHYEGCMVFDNHGKGAWEEWYHKRRKFLQKDADELTAEVLQRSFNHVIRTAMLIHLVLHDTMAICDKCIESAIKLIEYTDAALPKMMKQLKATGNATELEYVANQILRATGIIDHSSLVRKCSSRMTASALRAHIKTLEESKRIKIIESDLNTFYIIREEFLNAKL